MAWLKCQNAKPAPPIPVGVTYTNSYSKNAPISGYHETHNKSETINTRNVQSLTVRVDYSVRADATGALPDDSWNSYARNDSAFTFAVNGVTKLSTGNIRAESDNQGTQIETGTATYTITDLPSGDCVFDYNIWIESLYQNGEQLDTYASSSISFTITNVTYK